MGPDRFTHPDCQLNGVESFAWLEAALEAIAAGYPNDCTDDLVPWAFNPSTG